MSDVVVTRVCVACSARPVWAPRATLCAECKWQRKLDCDKRRAATPEGATRERERSKARRADPAYNAAQRKLKAAWKQANRQSYLSAHSAEERKRKYGVTVEDFARMLAAQSSACAICARTFDELTRRPDVDHCHRTGKVRGLLCSRCNTQIGVLEKLEERGLVAAACTYILRHR